MLFSVALMGIALRSEFINCGQQDRHLSLEQSHNRRIDLNELDVATDAALKKNIGGFLVLTFTLREYAKIVESIV